jgi:hypothetical protein
MSAAIEGQGRRLEASEVEAQFYCRASLFFAAVSRFHDTWLPCPQADLRLSMRVTGRQPCVALPPSWFASPCRMP